MYNNKTLQGKKIYQYICNMCNLFLIIFQTLNCFSNAYVNLSFASHKQCADDKFKYIANESKKKYLNHFVVQSIYTTIFQNFFQTNLFATTTNSFSNTTNFNLILAFILLLKIHYICTTKYAYTDFKNLNTSNKI